MENGVVRQISPPDQLYEYPNSRFVADFIGKMNLFEGQVNQTGNGQLALDIAGLGEVRVPFSDSASGIIGIAVRPEKMKLFTTSPTDNMIAFPGTVSNVAYHGSESRVFVRTDSGIELMATRQNDSRQGAAPGLAEPVWVGWLPEDTLVLID
jgi:ABC-type Fe3+/spermidine/putrescine transport system ATPase subunit